MKKYLSFAVLATLFLAVIIPAKTRLEKRKLVGQMDLFLEERGSFADVERVLGAPDERESVGGLECLTYDLSERIFKSEKGTYARLCFSKEDGHLEEVVRYAVD